jgi:hypothetical protein
MIDAWGKPPAPEYLWLLVVFLRRHALKSR